MQDIIYIRNISKKRIAGFTLHIESFSMQSGELVALVGPSGCGKSTALDLMSAILRPDFNHTQHEGKSQFYILVDNKAIDILALWHANKQNTLAKLRQQYIGYVLQTGGLLPFLSGKDNILLACDDKKAKQHALELAKILNINHLWHKKPLQMSVGERQRFAIARALVHKPKLILADEPVASLDPLNAMAVLKLLIKLAKEQSTSIIMVSHAPHVAKEMGFKLITTQLKQQGDEVISSLNTEAS